MKEKLNAYFSQKTGIATNFVVIVVVGILNLILCGMTQCTAFDMMMMALQMVFLALTFVFYIRHNVNGLQCTIGSFLGGQVLYWLYMLNYTEPETAQIQIIQGVIMLAMSVLVYATHLALISARQQKGKVLFINQLAGAIFMLAFVAAALATTATQKEPSLVTLSVIVFYVLCAAQMNFIITIESRINEYKIQRDALTAAGKWDDGAKAKLKKEIFG